MIPLFLSPPVTLDVRATPLAKALPMLAKAYVVRMRASPAIGGEIVILSLRDAALPALRERLAAAFAGAWSVERDGTLVFDVDAKARAWEAREEVARKVARVEAVLKLVRDEARTALAFTPERARARREAIGAEETPQTNAPVSSPGRRLFARVLAGMRAADLGLAVEDTRVVFSTRPTPMQRAFAFDVGPILRNWAREEGVWRESDPQSSEMTPGTPDRLTLAVSGSAEGVAFEMFGTDAKGAPLVAESDEIGFDQEEPDEAPGAPGPPDATLEANIELKPSPESLAFSRAFPFRQADEGAREEARPFLDVEAREPLSFLASDLAFAVARASGRSLVAAEPDATPAAEFVRSSGSPLRLRDLCRFLDLGKPGWAVMKSAASERGRRGFAPRAALARALTLAYASPNADLPTLARIAASVQEKGGEPALWPMVARLAPAADDRALLALFGDAATAVGPRVFSPEGVAIGELPPDLRTRAARLAFVRMATTFEVRARDGEAVGGVFEITTAFPNGLPPEARLRVRAAEEPMFRLTPVSGGEARTLDALGLAIAARERRDPQATEDRYDLDHIRVASQAQNEIGLALALSDGGDAGVFETIATIGATDPGTYTLATLPPAARAALSAAEAELARQDRVRASSKAAGESPPPGEAPPPVPWGRTDTLSR